MFLRRRGANPGLGRHLVAPAARPGAAADHRPARRRGDLGTARIHRDRAAPGESSFPAPGRSGSCFGGPGASITSVTRPPAPVLSRTRFHQGSPPSTPPRYERDHHPTAASSLVRAIELFRKQLHARASRGGQLVAIRSLHRRWAIVPAPMSTSAPPADAARERAGTLRPVRRPLRLRDAHPLARRADGGVGGGVGRSRLRARSCTRLLTRLRRAPDAARVRGAPVGRRREGSRARTCASTSSARTSATRARTRSTTASARCCSRAAWARRASSPRRAPASTASRPRPPARCSACPARSTWARSTSSARR